MSYEIPIFPTRAATSPESPLATPKLQRFVVVPRLPKALTRLRELAHNLFWVWTPIVKDLFVRIDPDLYDEVHGNPVELLARVQQSRLDSLAIDDAFLSHLDDAHAALHAYLSGKGWYAKTFGEERRRRIAYFSMEFGLHESLPIYSGGLGVLAGDHLKTASDLGLPLIGVGLAYAEGYFRQVLDGEGRQAERYPRNDWHRMPVLPVLTSDGDRLIIHVDYPGRVVHAQVWRVQVGRVPLFLLDANIEENAPADRAITGPLYGGDQELRVQQEVMLGIGGVHALAALALTPTVCHMNEGHSAFLALERIARVMRERGASFEVASEATSAGNVFTTHTPVPAGNDAFDPELVGRYLEPYRAALGIDSEALLGLGRVNAQDATEKFSMPVFAMRNAQRFNGVSELHGDVSRKMWHALWPETPEHEVPIASVTNGVHIPTWTSPEISALFTRYLGPRWAESTDDAALFARTQAIPDAELWQAHEHRRHRLVTLAREWQKRARKRSATPAVANGSAPELALDPRALTIGFARRFATYKRATLLFSDMERVVRLLGDPERPVQLVFAGKAHPQDQGGKELIKAIVDASRDPSLAGRVFFLEDYDMGMARALVSGVDVWLNTPRRPHEASGTSGMKAAANGALNVSILDGWWAEAYARHGSDVGWAIGRGEQYDGDEARGDEVEAELLYDVLEREVVPLFFDRVVATGLPRGWIQRMKASIANLIPEFNTARMVKEYSERFYVPALAGASSLLDDDLSIASQLVSWKERIRAAWPAVAVRRLAAEAASEVTAGDSVRVEANVHLGSLAPEDVVVELYFGATGANVVSNGGAWCSRLMRSSGDGPDGTFTFVGEIPTSESGAHAFTARVMPFNPFKPTPPRLDASMVRWA